MAITYSLQPIPKWYFADRAGRPLAGGFMFTYSSLTRQPKVVYTDIGGQFAWTNPIIFDANGTQGPFYWAFNSATPSDLYFIEIYDSDLNLQWVIDSFGAEGVGGSIVTNTTSIKNLITNNVFYRNIGQSVSGVPQTLTLAPGGHSGLGGNALPDINFIKDASTAVDQITFNPFPFGTNPIVGQVTPPYYLSYVCSNTPNSENIKVVRYPVTANVKNLENQPVTISFWARRNPASNSPNITINSLQFFGDGTGATAPFRQPLMSYDLSLIPGWNKYILNTTIPSAATKTTGVCGNTALFLEFAYPINTACNIDHTALSLYIGTLGQTPDFDTFDQIDSLIDTPRTGDIRTSLNTFYPFGWVPMNDGTIGSASSSAVTRANIDTFPLFSTLYLNVSDTFAPVSGGRTAPGNDLTSCIADFGSNKTIALTKMLGRAMAGVAPPIVNQTFTVLINPTNQLVVASTTSLQTGNPVRLTTTGTLPSPLQTNTTYYVRNIDATHVTLFATEGNAASGTNIIVITTAGTGVHSIVVPPYELGAYTGNEVHTLTIAEIPPHQHNTWSNAPGIDQENVGINDRASPNNAGTSGATGGGQPHSSMQPTTFLNVFIKL